VEIITLEIQCILTIENHCRIKAIITLISIIFRRGILNHKWLEMLIILIIIIIANILELMRIQKVLYNKIFIEKVNKKVFYKVIIQRQKNNIIQEQNTKEE
jgi:hypothetical protein